MDLLYKLKKSPEKFHILEDMKLQIRPIMYDVIDTIQFIDSGIVQIKNDDLPKKKLSELYTREQQNNNIINLSNYLYTNFKSIDYEKFISKFTPIFILETIAYKYKKKLLSHLCINLIDLYSIVTSSTIVIIWIY